MTAVFYFVNIYFTIVKGNTASKAGVQLLFYTPGLGVGVYAAMYCCNVYPRKTFPPLFLGSIVEALGITILTWALNKGHTPTIYGMMALSGVGTGLRSMPGTLHGIGFFPNHITSVISVFSFAILLGGAVGMTLMESVFNNKFALPSAQGSSSATTSNPSYIDSISLLPTDVQDAVRDTAQRAVVWAFIAILPLMWLCVVAAALLGNVDITMQQRDEDEEGLVDWSENTYEGVYLLSGLMGRNKDSARRRKREGDADAGNAAADTRGTA